MGKPDADRKGSAGPVQTSFLVSDSPGSVCSTLSSKEAQGSFVQSLLIDLKRSELQSPRAALDPPNDGDSPIV
jgi:hypothetical protein